MKHGLIAGLCVGVLALLGWPGAVLADPRQGLRPVAEGELPALLDVGDSASLREAIIQSLAWLTRRPPRSTFAFGTRVVTASEQARALERVLEFLADDPAPDLLERFLLDEFDVMRSVGQGDGTMLVTGYHEITIDAALRPSAEYRVPILAPPATLSERAAVTPAQPTRAEIEAGRLAHARPLAWARDAVDVFFMEVEGSGTLRLTDGRELRVGYAGTNGRPYRSIARLLIDEGHIDREAMSMRALREWLAANPDQTTRVLHHNQSYVFFGQRDGPPLGSLGVPLTPGRSIATDPRIFPPGSLAFLLTERPRRGPGGDVEWAPVSRFVLSQDVGGVIRGPGRVDVFWGRGPAADLAASEMKQPGEIYVLVPKPPGIRPLPTVKPDAEIAIQTPIGARTSETVRRPDAETRDSEAETRVAEAGARAIAEPPPRGQIGGHDRREEDDAMDNAPTPQTRASDHDVRTLGQLNHGYVQAAQASDARWFDDNLAACFMASNPDGSLVDRAGFLERIARPNPTTHMASVGPRIRVVGDVGIVDSGFRFTTPDGGEGAGHYTDVYGFVDGRWQGVSAHFAVRPAPPQTGAARTADVVAGLPSADDHATLADLNRHYIRSVQDSDVRWFEANLASEFVNGNADGSFSDRAAFLALVGKPSPVSNLRAADVRIQTVGDIGIIHARTAYTRSDGEAGAGRYTDIWWRADGRWRCVSAHVTRG